METNNAQLTDILARLAAAERELAARRDRAPRRRARSGRLATVALALFLALTPLSLLGASFVDLNPGSPHNADINAIADAGISKGCSDAQHYCPNAFVTREQMASFLARTAGLGGNPAVANAATIGGKRADGLVRVARGSSGLDFLASSPTYFFVPETAVYPKFVPMPGAAVTIEAPADGFVLVTAVVGLFQDVGDRPHVRLRDTTPGAPATAVSPVVFEQESFDQAVDQLEVSWVFPVTGMGTKTFALEVAQSSSVKTNDIRFFNDILTALYVPFGYDGGSSLAP